MPAHKKSISELELSGSLEHDKKRHAVSDLVVEGGIGNAPTYLTNVEKKLWKEQKKTLTWLTAADRNTLEMMVKLIIKMRNNEIKPAESTTLLSLLSKMGCTPTDRNRVKSPPPPKEDNPFEDL